MKEKILEILSSIKYPGKEQSIVELQMIENLQFENQKVSFDLIFPTHQNPLKESIKRAAINLLHTVLGEKTLVEIKVQSRVPQRQVKSGDILPGVKNIIAISSGKGGVGKSTISANLAVALAQSGAKVGLVDADIYGPSIPKMFGVEGEMPDSEEIEGKVKIYPVEKYGVKLISIGFFVKATDATVWRGPMASGALKQLISDAEWGELDYLLIDLPPGTSDIHLTLVQTVPVTGAIIVSTPQKVALADVIKGLSMFRDTKINVPVLGLVENMAWFTPAELPENKYYIFGKEGCRQLAEKLDIPFLGQIPIVQSICEDGDAGIPSALRSDVQGKAFSKLATSVVNRIIERNAKEAPTQKVEIKK